jgi:hypothetical protein
MACFVFAAVLIGRISIEEGLERAMPFGAALAIVVGIAANRFVEYQGSWVDHIGWLINWSLIGIIWWCAHKLTWDCTVIDESEDASGEGLMQIVGLEKPASADTAEAPTANPIEVEGTTSRQVPTGWWQRYVEHQRRPHAPGVWVVYFSLAALPLFGIGQWFIPVASTGARRYVFWLLCVYVASGLGLLLTTSFLGLRRYLRQRRVEMPAVMSNLWLATGATIIAALLIVATLLPRPSAEYAISELPFSVGSPSGATSSRFAPNSSDAPDDGRAGQGQAAKPEDESGQDDRGEAAQSGPQAEREVKAASPSSREAKQASDQAQSAGNKSSEGDQQSGGNSSDSKQSPGRKSKSSSGDEQGQGEQRQGQDSGGQRAKPQSAKKARDQRIERMMKELAARQKPSQTPPSDEQAAEEPPANEQASEKQANDEQPDAEQPDQERSSEEQPVAQSEETPAEEAAPAETEVAKQQEEPAEKPTATSAPKMPAPPPPSLPTPPLGFAAELLKWAFYAAFALAVVYFVWRYWSDILAAIRDFWVNLFGGKKAVKVSSEAPAVIRVPPAPFSTFADRLRRAWQGATRSMSWCNIRSRRSKPGRASMAANARRIKRPTSWRATWPNSMRRWRRTRAIWRSCIREPHSRKESCLTQPANNWRMPGRRCAA